MKTWKWVVASAASLMILAGCGQDTDEGKQGATQEQASGPEKLYQNYCASCHGQNLEGNMGPELKGVGDNMSKEDIELIIEKGRGQMPAQNRVSPEDRTSLAEWLVKQ